MYENDVVSNRHMRAWWIWLDDGSSMRSVRGRRRVWRAAKRAAEEARDENWVGETQRATEEVERERVRKEMRKTEQAEQRSHPAPYAALAANHNNRSSRNSSSSSSNSRHAAVVCQ